MTQTNDKKELQNLMVKFIQQRMNPRFYDYLKPEYREALKISTKQNESNKTK